MEVAREVIGWSIYGFLGVLVFYLVVYPSDYGTFRLDGFVTWAVGGLLCFVFTGLCIYED